MANIHMSLPSQDGLRWTETLFDLVPEWTREPSIAAIEDVCRQQLSILPQEPCTVTFHASGLLNKLYTIESTRGPPMMMRVSLPVYPRHKTRAEVATLRWVRDHTTIPVPEVFGFDDSNDNAIGFEWILMERMDGAPAHTRWWAMSMGQKVAFTERIAQFQAELSGFGKGESESVFRSIGTLDLRETDDGNNLKGRTPGLLVSPRFFMGNHLYYDVPRGPFRSSHDWLSAELDIIQQHQTDVLKNSEDEDEREDAEDALAVARKLLALLPKFFPPTLEQPEVTALYHHNLHLNNILVNEGQITAVLDWECVSAMPLWMSATLPEFLERPVREEEPQRESYIRKRSTAGLGGSDVDGEESSELYFEHKMEYEATQLRKVYEARLKELWPGWPLEDSHAEIDLFEAISQCDGIWVKRIGRWADRVEKGETIRLDTVYE